jgi:hypothetical protein
MVDTLNKFGVPLGGGDGRGGILQPKQKHKFRVRVTNFGPIAGGIELTQQVMTVARPTISHEPVQLDSYNSRAYIQGKHTWSPIELTMRDDVTNSISKLVGYQLQKQINHFEQTSPLAGINYKFTMFIEQMDGGNDVVLDQWVLEGCFITDANEDSYDYGSGEVMTVSLTIQYDNATNSDGLFPELPIGLPGVRA